MPPNSADADLVRALEDLRRQPILGGHHPFALPIATDERDDRIVDKGTTALTHQALLFGKPMIVHIPSPGELMLNGAARNRTSAVSPEFAPAAGT